MTPLPRRRETCGRARRWSVPPDLPPRFAMVSPHALVQSTACVQQRTVKSVGWQGVSAGVPKISVLRSYVVKTQLHLSFGNHRHTTCIRKHTINVSGSKKKPMAQRKKPTCRRQGKTPNGKKEISRTGIVPLSRPKRTRSWCLSDSSQRKENVGTKTLERACVNCFCAYNATHKRFAQFVSTIERI